jgi:hypothetical protein
MAPSDVKNGGSLQTLGALGTPGDLVQAMPSAHVYRNGTSPATEPCRVCDGTERWNDHGTWRCVVCWPPKVGV